MATRSLTDARAEGPVRKSYGDGVVTGHAVSGPGSRGLARSRPSSVGYVNAPIVRASTVIYDDVGTMKVSAPRLSASRPGLVWAVRNAASRVTNSTTSSARADGPDSAPPGGGPGG